MCSADLLQLCSWNFFLGCVSRIVHHFKSVVFNGGSCSITLVQYQFKAGKINWVESTES